jgi:hypothetical protein
VLHLLISLITLSFASLFVPASIRSSATPLLLPSEATSKALWTLYHEQEGWGTKKTYSVTENCRHRKNKGLAHYKMLLQHKYLYEGKYTSLSSNDLVVGTSYKEKLDNTGVASAGCVDKCRSHTLCRASNSSMKETGLWERCDVTISSCQ